MDITETYHIKHNVFMFVRMKVIVLVNTNKKTKRALIDPDVQKREGIRVGELNKAFLHTKTTYRKK